MLKMWLQTVSTAPGLPDCNTETEPEKQEIYLAANLVILEATGVEAPSGQGEFLQRADEKEGTVQSLQPRIQAEDWQVWGS